MTTLNIIDLIEKNPITKLNATYNNKLINKIKKNFTETQQQLFIASLYSYLHHNQNTAVKVDLILFPPWTTDWISENGKNKLREYGIAPPENEVDKSVLFAAPTIVPCPLCRSKNTKMISQFGSTACKAHYQCNDCLEPFDYFKCLR